GGQMVHENVCVQEDGTAGRDLGRGHALSWGSNSGSMARRSSVSRSPDQGIMPAVRSAQPVAASIVTRTVSCSFRGRGWRSLRVPFSYVASTVMVMTDAPG